MYFNLIKINILKIFRAAKLKKMLPLARLKHTSGKFEYLCILYRINFICLAALWNLPEIIKVIKIFVPSEQCRLHSICETSQPEGLIVIVLSRERETQWIFQIKYFQKIVPCAKLLELTQSRPHDRPFHKFPDSKSVVRHS